jgi:hypothetical protein
LRYVACLEVVFQINVRRMSNTRVGKMLDRTVYSYVARQEFFRGQASPNPPEFFRMSVFSTMVLIYLLGCLEFRLAKIDEKRRTKSARDITSCTQIVEIDKTGGKAQYCTTVERTRPKNNVTKNILSILRK